MASSSSDIKLNYQVWGEEHLGSKKTPLLILHGLLGSSKNWTSNGQYFGKSRPVYTLDMRNHGASFHSSDFDYFHMASDLEHFLSAHNIEQAFILGHSMGGRAAIVHSLLYPRRVRGLIIVDIVPSLQSPDPHIPTVVAAAHQVDFQRVQNRSDVLQQLEAGGITWEGIRNFVVLCNLKRNDDGSFGWVSNIQAISEQLDKILHWPEEKLRGLTQELPLCLIYGGKSPYVEADGLARLQSYFPSTEEFPNQIICIDEAKHWPHTEQASQFRYHLDNFLAKTDHA